MHYNNIHIKQRYRIYDICAIIGRYFVVHFYLSIQGVYCLWVEIELLIGDHKLVQIRTY